VPLGDNNRAIGWIGGFGLNLMDGSLTVRVLTQFGREQASRFLSPLGASPINFGDQPHRASREGSIADRTGPLP
jgi:hypothetical protein